MMILLLPMMMMMMLTSLHRPGHSHDRVCAWVNFSHCLLPQVSPSIPQCRPSQLAQLASHSIPQCKTTICKFVGSVDLMHLPPKIYRDEMSLPQKYKSGSRYTNHFFFSGCGLFHLHTTSSLRFHLLKMFKIDYNAKR